MRQAEVKRQTRETQIECHLDLDGRGQAAVKTGVGFLDHMLEQIAVHGLFDLTLRAQGDLHIDVHHTVEDCALVLGTALDRALGDRAGIRRMGWAYAPMDDTLAFVAVDLSGRPYAVFQAEWRMAQLGGIPTSLFEHFLASLSVTARCNLHTRALYSRDDHHQAEAIFKALGRALDAATQVDERRSGSLPSSKGAL